ncbi:MAG: hypothetical protein FWF41_04765 [Betaproteobacteria bacterium]|nr:hypothetical protein [Betaproteobacteria bacterium]
MVSLFYRFRMALSAWGLSALALFFFAVTPMAHAASVTYNGPTGGVLMYTDPGCTTYFDFLDGVLSCHNGTGGGDSSPTGCTISGQSTVDSSGGPFALTGGCTSGATSYVWGPTSYIQSSSTQSSVSTSATVKLPTNSGTADAQYSVTMTAYNGTATPVTITKQVTVSGTGGTPPPSDCGSAVVTNLNLSWGGVAIGGSGSTGVVVAKVTVPTDAVLGSNSIVISENGGSPTTRFITISKTACDTRSGRDYLGDTAPMIQGYASYLNQKYVTMTGYNYPTLLPGKTYYINVWNKNQDGSTSCFVGSCPILITMNASK